MNLKSKLEDVRKIDVKKYMKSLGIEDESVRLGVERFLREAKEVEGQIVHERLNLYVDMGIACSASCDFCIAKIRDKSHRAKDLKAQLEGLKKAIKLCYSVEMLGGEPLLYANDIRQMMPYIKTRMSVFVTNATKALFLANLDLLSEFDHVDISRHALDEAANKLAFRTVVDLMTREDIEALTPGMKDKIRFNTTCFVGGMDSPEKMLTFVNDFSGRGIKQFMFANLTLLSKGIYEVGVEEFTDKNRLPNEVFDEFEKVLNQEGYGRTKSIHGLGYKVRILEKDGVKVVLKENDDTNNQVLLKDLYKRLGLLADLVLTPNGEAYSDWYYSNRVL